MEEGWVQLVWRHAVLDDLSSRINAKLTNCRSQGGYIDHVISEKSNRAMYDFWAEKIRARMKNPQKRDLLAPLEPPYFISTKRPSLEQDYYEMVRSFERSGIILTPC